jgi:hypothetical protein
MTLDSRLSEERSLGRYYSLSDLESLLLTPSPVSRPVFLPRHFPAPVAHFPCPSSAKGGRQATGLSLMLEKCVHVQARGLDGCKRGAFGHYHMFLHWLNYSLAPFSFFSK